jgi:hypothetical protein
MNARTHKHENGVTYLGTCSKDGCTPAMPRFYLWKHDASSQKFSGSARFHVIDRETGRSVRALDSERDALADIQIRNGLGYPGWPS